MSRWSLLRTPGVAVTILVLTVASACRPPDPPPVAARNLGTADRPLLPRPTPHHDQSILNGRATPIRAADIPEEEPEETGPTGAGEAPVGREPTDEDRDLIQEVVELVVRALVEGNLNEIAGFIVSEQSEPATRLARALSGLARAGEELNSALEEKAPAVLAQFKSMAAGAAPGLSGFESADADQIVRDLKVTNLRMTGDSTATGRVGVPPQTVPLEFELVDEEWYIRLPAPLVTPEMVAAVERLFGALEDQFADITGRLQDDSLPPEQLMPEFMRAMQELQPVLAEQLPVIERVVAELAAPAGAEVPDDVRQALEDLLADYDDAEDDRRFDDLAALHAPEQHDALTEVLDPMESLYEAVDGFVDALVEAYPDDEEAIRQLGDLSGGPETLSELRTISPTRLAGTLSGGGVPGPIEFHLIDDEWYLWNPLLSVPELVDLASELIASATEAIESLTEQVEDDGLTLADAHFQYRTMILLKLLAGMTTLQAGAVSDVPGDVVVAIAELLADYDDAEAEIRADDLAALHTPQQQESAARFFEAFGALFATVDDLTAAIDEVQPGAAASVRQGIARSLAARQRIIEMHQAAPEKILATISAEGKQNPQEFRLIDDEWYLWNPDLDDDDGIERLLDLFDSTVEAVEALNGQLDDGELEPSQAVSRLMEIIQAFETRMAELRSGTTDEAPADEEQEEPSLPEDQEPEEVEPPQSRPPSMRGFGDEVG